MNKYWISGIIILLIVFLSGCIQQGPSDADLMSKALGQINPSFCGEIRNLETKNYCYYELGVYTLNVSICEFITNVSLKQDCVGTRLQKASRIYSREHPGGTICSAAADWIEENFAQYTLGYVKGVMKPATYGPYLFELGDDLAYYYCYSNYSSPFFESIKGCIDYGKVLDFTKLQEVKEFNITIGVCFMKDPDKVQQALLANNSVACSAIVDLNDKKLCEEIYEFRETYR
jgi:hypothetical protein